MNLTKQQMEHMATTMAPEQIKDWVQREAHNAWKQAGFRGTIEAATGVGKTRIALLAAEEELRGNPEAVVYIGVPTETLRDTDWPNEFRKWGMEALLDRVTLVCHVSMDKVRETREVDLFIWDECHHATVINSLFFHYNKVYKVLGLTATMPNPRHSENDSDKRGILDDLCPSVFQVSIEEAIQLKLVSEFEVKVLTFDLDDKDAYIKAGTKDRPFMQTEAGQYRFMTKSLQRATFSKKEGLKMMWIQKRMHFLYNLRTKERLAREIMDKILEGKRTLIFCGSIEQAEKLCGKQVYHSQTDDEQLALFQEGKIDYLGAIQALNEGKNIDNLDQILVVQLNSKELGIIQRIGRSIRFRPGHTAQVVVLVAKGTADEKWYKKAFENFNQSRIKVYYVKPEADRSAAAR